MPARGLPNASSSSSRPGFTSWPTERSPPTTSFATLSIANRCIAACRRSVDLGCIGCSANGWTLCSPGRQELAAEVALHFEKGLAHEIAIDYLVLAAENAAVRFAYRDSIQVLQHALTLVPRVAPERQADL